jgi:hypothetical protein
VPGLRAEDEWHVSLSGTTVFAVPAGLRLVYRFGAGAGEREHGSHGGRLLGGEWRRAGYGTTGRLYDG